MPIIPIAIQVAKQVFKHRKYIYKTLVAQDRAIDKAFRIGGYGRQTRYGVRHGIVAGSVLGTLINNADDSPGNGIQKVFKKQPAKTNKPYKTRRRSTVRCRPEYKRRSNFR